MFARLKSIVRAVLPDSWWLFLANMYMALKFLSGNNSLSIRDLRSLHSIWLSVHAMENNLETLLKLHYPSHVTDHAQKAVLRNHEFKVYSQNGEDGILLYLFSQIGTTDRGFVDIGGGGLSSNTTNLVANFGWSGLVVDGDSQALASLLRSYNQASASTSAPGDYHHPCYGRRLQRTDRPIKTVTAWITTENINEVLLEHQMQGEIDLLSIDIDGNDYWVWQAITAVQPRVVAIEYNGSFGPTRSVTVKYDEHFDKLAHHPRGWYHGASLAALAKLADAKGYILAGCESMGINAFFIRSDAAREHFAGLPANEAFNEDVRRRHFASPEQQYDQIKHLAIVEV